MRLLSYYGEVGTVNSTILLNGQGHWDLRTFGDGIVNNATTPTVIYYYQLEILYLVIIILL